MCVTLNIIISLKYSMWACSAGAMLIRDNNATRNQGTMLVWIIPPVVVVVVVVYKDKVYQYKGEGACVIN